MYCSCSRYITCMYPYHSLPQVQMRKCRFTYSHTTFERLIVTKEVGAKKNYGKIEKA